MENRAYALSAGLFVVVLGIGLVLAALRLTGDAADQREFVIESMVPVSGLQENAPVRLRGVDVGKVTGVRFSHDDPRLVLISIAVDANAPMRKGTYAQLGYLGITGLSYIQLDIDQGPQEEADTGQPARIIMRPSLLDEVTGAAPEFVQDTAQAAKRVNRLLNDENLSRVSGTISNINLASADIAGLVSELRPVAKALTTATARMDNTLQQLDPLLANLNSLTGDMRARLDAVDRIGESAENLGRAGRAIESTVPTLNQALDDFSRSLRRVDRVLAGIEQQPQSFLFGRRPPPPGPGEQGFAGPAGTP